MIEKIAKTTKFLLIVTLFWSAILFVYAIFANATIGEAYTGSFRAKDFSDGWTLIDPDGNTVENVQLPTSVKTSIGSTVTLKNTLPADVKNGMRLMTRASMSDITVKVNGHVQGKYSKFNFMTYRDALISSFLLIELHNEDANGDIELIITSNKNGTLNLNTVTYAYGNNVWFPYIEDNLPLAAMAFALLFVGLGAILTYFVFQRRTGINRSLLFLGMLTAAIGMWMASESWLRQLIFGSPSYANIFSYLLIETAAGFAAMYFDEIQQHRYRKPYVILVSLLLLQVVVNTILNFTHVKDYYYTLVYAHVWSGLIILWVFISLFLDIRSGNVRKYSRIAIGMLGILFSGLLEMIEFYRTPSAKLGIWLGCGLLFLVAMTVTQTVRDMLDQAEERRLYSEKMNEMTFQTIASTIDAKDEYTGGHSSRVGEYARKIAEKIAAKEQLSEGDLNRLQYIGQMHDIGKIGVPDKVLNKPGKLDEKEFDQMKQHTVIGSEILKNLETIPGLKDGVRSHHERWDGKGYPDGLKGEETPLFARILCLADCFDAMTTDRIYRKRLPKEKVIEELEKNKGTQFDPVLADVVLDMIKNGELTC